MEIMGRDDELTFGKLLSMEVEMDDSKKINCGIHGCWYLA